MSIQTATAPLYDFTGQKTVQDVEVKNDNSGGTTIRCSMSTHDGSQVNVVRHVPALNSGQSATWEINGRYVAGNAIAGRADLESTLKPYLNHRGA